jgi:hypothetical protein
MSYEIYWDAGSLGQDFVELHIAYSPFTYYIYTVEFPAVLPSQPYQFIYRATNSQGTGLFSDPAIIFAADIPSQIAPAVTTKNGLNIVIDWNPP